MKYRAEIDGLRALAVVPVILFHAGFNLFQGGFVGVDIFFVISGYLITTILVDDIEGNRFSILNFYERRARRILPALFLVMALCIPFAWMWMLPREMQDFSQSLVGVTVFLSNILFWRESGYFEAATAEKPLLHTWSLGVEEQYYLAFPIFLFLMWRFGKNRVFWSIVVISGLSLALSEWGWRNQSAFNFYFPVTRAWELFAGSISAFIVQKHGVRANNPLSVLGFGAVLFAIFGYDETVPFPSVYALVPVLGVVLLVLYAGQGTLVARLLSTRVFVGIGLISYSAYLWHQPLLAFARIRLIETPGLWVMSALAVLSLVLAVISWRYVETPFRNKAIIGRRGIFLFSAFFGACFIAFGLYGHFKLGFEGRMSPDVMALMEFEAENVLLRDDGGCNVTDSETVLAKCVYGDESNVHVALVGDSHASTLAIELGKIGSENGFGLYRYTKNACPSIVGFIDTANRNCYDFVENTLADIQASDTIDVVFVVNRLGYYISEDNVDNGTGGVEIREVVTFYTQDVSVGDDLAVRKKAILDGYVSTVERLARENPDKRIVLLTPIPEPGWHIPKQLAKLAMFGGGGKLANLSLEVYKSRNAEVFPVFKQLETISNVSVYDVTQFLCDGTECLLTKDGNPMYYDDDHLSGYGARIVLQDVLQFIN